MKVGKTFLESLGFTFITSERSGAYSNIEIWRFTWEKFDATIRITKLVETSDQKEDYDYTMHFHAWGYMGDKNYGGTKDFYYGSIKATTEECKDKLYRAMRDFARTELQWNLRRLLGTEDERGK